MNNAAVIGLGYGDESKGSFTSFLCSRKHYAMVARFSGGPQASHKVMVNGKEHVFSNYGSGALQGVNTYWMKHCLVDPISLVAEFDILDESAGIQPKIFIHRDCPLITPYDMLSNRTDVNHLANGTCGRGIGKTIEREEKLFSLTFSDIFHEKVLQTKLEQIRLFYYNYTKSEHHDLFLERCRIIRDNSDYFCLSDYMDFDNTVFEGSQGLMLDQNIGFFPHVTRGNTGTKNIAQYYPEIYLVTRAYQTRHGVGFLSNADIPHTIELSAHEHNVKNLWQGEFRLAILDLDILKYAIDKDDYIRLHRKNLAITCLDNISKFDLTINSKLLSHATERQFVETIRDYLGVDGEIFLSRTPFSLEFEVY